MKKTPEWERLGLKAQQKGCMHYYKCNWEGVRVVNNCLILSDDNSFIIASSCCCGYYKPAIECCIVKHIAKKLPDKILEDIILFANKEDTVSMARDMYAYKKKGI